jgi:cytochrome c6
MDVRSLAALKIAVLLAVTSFGISATTLLNNNNTGLRELAGDPLQRSGATVFSQVCSRCHGVDGRANTAKGRAVGATDLTSKNWTPNAERDTRIVNRGKEEMPAFKGKLKPAEIDAVVSYIRRFKN